jgi:hemerythrin superfamily protein
MYATHVLGAQHQAIAELFERAQTEVEPRARARAVGRLAEELIAHMAGEETVFYPALGRILGRGDESVAAARDGHVRLKVELRRALASNPEDEAFAERVAALQRMFERHVREEETRLFPRVDRALGDVDHEVLGAEILASRPPIWMVTTERTLPRRRGIRTRVRSRVTLPIPAAGD